MTEPQGDDIAGSDIDKEQQDVKQGSLQKSAESPAEPSSHAKADQRASRTRLASTKLIGSIGTLKRRGSHLNENKRLRSGAQINTSEILQKQQHFFKPKAHKTNVQLPPSADVLTCDQYLSIQQNLYGVTANNPLPKFLYKPFTPMPDISAYQNRHIEIRVHKCYVVRHNKAFRERLFFGQDQYTSDSDIVCMMQHFGYVVPHQEETGFEAFAVICKVLKGKPSQQAYLRNGIKSRKVTGFEGHNLKVEQVFKL